MWRPKTPQSLLDSARAGQLALVFGPGADLGTTHEDPSLSLPTANGLRDMLCLEYFGGDRRFESLETLARDVVAARGEMSLKSWLKRVSLQFTPNAATRALPKYDWRGLCALGYDSTIEIAYQMAGRALLPLGPDAQQKHGQFLLRPLEWTNDGGLPQALLAGGHLNFNPDDVDGMARFLNLITTGPVAFFGTSPEDRVLIDLMRVQSESTFYVSSTAGAGLWPSTAEVHDALFGDMMKELRQPSAEGRA